MGSDSGVGPEQRNPAGESKHGRHPQGTYPQQTGTAKTQGGRPLGRFGPRHRLADPRRCGQCPTPYLHTSGRAAVQNIAV